MMYELMGRTRFVSSGTTPSAYAFVATITWPARMDPRVVSTTNPAASRRIDVAAVRSLIRAPASSARAVIPAWNFAGCNPPTFSKNTPESKAVLPVRCSIRCLSRNSTGSPARCSSSVSLRRCGVWCGVCARYN